MKLIRLNTLLPNLDDICCKTELSLSYIESVQERNRSSKKDHFNSIMTYEKEQEKDMRLLGFSYGL